MLLYGLQGCPAGETDLYGDGSVCAPPSGGSGAPVCSAGYVWNAAENACDWPVGAGPGSAPAAQSQGSGTPWYATLTSSFAQGATKGLLTPTPGVPAAPTSFFATPAGIGVIAIGLIALIMVLKK
jgi:hypothetical protein